MAITKERPSDSEIRRRPMVDPNPDNQNGVDPEEAEEKASLLEAKSTPVGVASLHIRHRGVGKFTMGQMVSVDDLGGMENVKDRLIPLGAVGWGPPPKDFTQSEQGSQRKRSNQVL